jgi:hypothetical protein
MNDKAARSSLVMVTVAPPEIVTANVVVDKPLWLIVNVTIASSIPSLVGELVILLLN